MSTQVNSAQVNKSYKSYIRDRVETTPQEELKKLQVERLRAGIDTGMAAKPQANGLTISVGVATLISGEDPPHLIARADTALYQSKRAGRNRVTRAE